MPTLPTSARASKGPIIAPILAPEEIKPKSRGAADFEELAKEVIERSRILIEKAEQEPIQPQDI